MALPSEDEVCRKCGRPLLLGEVKGDAGVRPAGIVFIPANSPPWPAGPSAGLILTPLTFGRSPRLPAKLCPSCQLVEFQYVVEKGGQDP